MYLDRKTQAKLQIMVMMIGIIGMGVIIGTWVPTVFKDLAPDFDFWAGATLFSIGVIMMIPIGLMVLVLQIALREFVSGGWGLFLDSLLLIVWAVATWLFSWFMWQLMTNAPGIDDTVVLALQVFFALVTLLPIVLFIFHDIAVIRNKPSQLSGLLN